MKSAVVGLLLCFAFQGRADNFQKERPQPMNGAYVPRGFDTDDTVEIMVTGLLRDSCSQIGAVSSVLDEGGKKLVLALTSHEYSGRCLKTKVPFYLPVYVGRLRQAGVYSIQDGVSGQSLGRLEIRPAGSGGGGVDDLIYPPLTDAYVLAQSGRPALILKGVLPSDCLAVGDVKIEVQGNVVVAMPKLARIEGQSCRAGNFGFSKTVALTERMPRGMYLLHVRAMGGRSINKMEFGY